MPLHLLVEANYLRREAIDGRANFFLQKPFMASDVRTAVRAAIQVQAAAART
jgi:hypothetical protein